MVAGFHSFSAMVRIAVVGGLIGSGMGVLGQAAPGAAASGSTAQVAQPARNGNVSAWASSHERQMMLDWPDLAKFKEKDAALPPATPDENRVVFMGDSITEIWPFHGPYPLAKDNEFFPGKFYVNRGISGQTTPQMLVRFRQDVIDLHPKVVVILAGTNDLAGNTGPETAEDIENNLKSMSDLAHANGIQVVLCSILPVYDYPWKPGLQPAPKIVAINQWMKSYAAEKGYVYVDYYSAMVDARGGLPANLSKDGVHPNEAGFKIMAPLAQAGIEQALAKEPKQ
jgi:acyl-CoA thioesterase-1